MLFCRGSELTSLDECEALYIMVCLFLFQICSVRKAKDMKSCVYINTHPYLLLSIFLFSFVFTLLLDKGVEPSPT